MKINKKYINRMLTLGVALTLGGTLAGCGSTYKEEKTDTKIESTTIQEENNEDIENTIIVPKSKDDYMEYDKRFEKFKENPGVKICEPGEHIIIKSYYLDYGNHSVDVPEGYHVLSAVPVHTGDNYLEVCLENEETVIVKPTYREKTESFDYSTPGEIYDKENLDQNKLLQKAK